MAKLLALTSRLCYPPREGHQLRTWHLLRALAREHEISLLSFMRADDDLNACAPLRDMLERLETFPIAAERSRLALAGCLLRGVAGARPFVVEKYTSAAMRERVTELAAQADLIHVDMLPLMSAIPTTVKVPLVLNAHNVEHLLLRQRAEIESQLLRRLFLRSQTTKLERFETLACRRADQLLACSEVDAAQLAELAPNTSIAVIPNGVDTQLNRPDASQRSASVHVVFVGQMAWFPNADGVRWFLDEIFPRILAQRPEVKFVLVGKSQGVSIPPALAERVRIAGFVDDVRAAVRAAAVYIVPLRAGSGTRLKVLEAMALGMPIVTTRIGAEGIALVPESSALFADSPEDFAAAVLRLLADAGLAARLGAAARNLAVEQYEWQKVGADLLGIYARLLHDHRASA